jgi:beta-lactamase regulating signal transducer with metallopeptidase domain
MAAADYFPIVYKTDLLKDVFAVGGTIWAILAAGAVLCSVLLYVFTKSALKGAVHIEKNIYQSDKITTPAVYGVIRPKIILPVGLGGEDLEYILMHERVHIRRRDNLWRVAAVITACVHWFNPLVWLFMKRFFVDMELACDAGVLKNLDQESRKSYASALLSCAAGKAYYASAFGGAKTRLRIENILSYQKLTLVSALAFALFIGVIAITLITNAVG